MEAEKNNFQKETEHRIKQLEGYKKMVSNYENRIMGLEARIVLAHVVQSNNNSISPHRPFASVEQDRLQEKQNESLAYQVGAWLVLIIWLQ